MSGITTIERAEAIAEQAGATGKIVAYQLGARYPRFGGVSREALAQVFDAHNFTAAAKDMRDIDDRRALSEAVSRRSKTLCEAQARVLRNGAGALKVKFVCRELDTAQDHMRAWGIVREERASAERSATYSVGARVFVSPAGIFAADPIDTSPDADCMVIAKELARYAQWLLTNADTPDASRALTLMYSESNALSFIARGTYLAPIGRPGTDRVVKAIREIYAKFYSETSRSGIRARAVAVTEHDQAALSDSVIDDFDTRAAELIGFLKGEVGRSNVKQATLAARYDAARNFLADLGPAKSLLGTWCERFEKIGTAIRDAYSAAVDGQTLALPDEVASVTDPDAEVPLPVEIPADVPLVEPEHEPPSEPEHDADLAPFDLS